ncbi:hypothetical protein GGX14DRAFT_700642 [Mycena pura]|uniref:DUF6593 domain-containing protein n=1 Tax=Mycena pura TaxID=153505 RepID=A0AAD6Y645_9AGAR|nr:hypothetical protein GGX14DRAFT_700642 [Mycena pura]
MDSQLTLVNPTPPVTLTFSTDSMNNATLFAGARPAYAISTQLQGSTTEIRKAGTAELVARIARREILPNTIVFPDVNGGREIKLSKWLRRCKQPDGLRVHVIDTEVGQCLLRQHRIYRLALFTEFDLETPVAHWDRVDGQSPLSLVLYSGTENFHPQIIAAFIIEELRMRMAEKADTVAQGRAAATGTPLASLGHGAH